MGDLSSEIPSRKFQMQRMLGAFLCLALGACASAPTQPKKGNLEFLTSPAANPAVALEQNPSAPARPHLRNPDEIAPGYEIRLSSLEDQNLNGKFRVEFEGKLKLPYNVVISTDGLDKNSLREKIRDSYRGYFKTTPAISVAVSDEKLWLEVRGLVEKPGRILVKDNTSLDEIISLAGGLQKNATVRYVKIQQRSSSPLTIKLSEYYGGSAQSTIPKWEGADVIFLQSDRDDQTPSTDGDNAYIQLLGEVKTPGEIRVLKGADFYYYLSKAGGPTQQANLSKIEIVRGPFGNRNSSQVFELTDPTDIPQIRAGDMVIVHAEKPTATERTVTLAAGITSIINTVLLIILLF